MSDQLIASPDGWRDLCIACGAVRRPACHVPALSLTVHTGPHSEHTVVTVSGEIDFASGPVLGQTLQEALDHSAGGVDVDLAGVGFCDCSGLNVLLHVRRRALEVAKTLTVRDFSPAVQRLLELTGTVDVLTATDMSQAHAARNDSTPSALGPGQTADPTADGVRAENEQLRRAMQTRPAIDIARRILMASYTITAEQAWHVLVSTSQNSNTKLYLLAETLLNTVRGQNLPEPLASHLAIALQEHCDQPLSA